MELCFWIKKKGKTDENCNEVSQLFSISFFTKEKQAFFQEHQVTKINLNLLEFPEDLESFPCFTVTPIEHQRSWGPEGLKGPWGSSGNGSYAGASRASGARPRIGIP